MPRSEERDAATGARAFGPALATWIDQQLNGTPWRPLALAAGIEPTRLKSWRRGALPGLDQISLVAGAFKVTRIDVLIGIGFLDAAETATERVVDLDYALAHDPAIEDETRELLRTMFHALAARSVERVASPRQSISG